MLASGLLAVLAITRVALHLPPGLAARYFPNPTWTAPATIETIDAPPSTFSVATAWGEARPEATSVVWHGSVLILRDGTYTFATISDDGSSVAIDDAPVVDNGGEHGPRLATGRVALQRGVHRTLIRYFDAGGGSSFTLLWAVDGAPLAPLPAWRLRPATPSWAAALSIVGLDALQITLAWIVIALAICVVIRAIARRTAARWIALRAAWHPWMIYVLGVSIAITLAGVWWGLPAAWAPDEITPPGVLDGLAHGFSHGWFSRYPPLSHAVIALAELPVLVLHALGAVTLHDGVGAVLLWIAGRLVSVAMAAATLIAVETTTRRLFGARAAVLAAATLALVLPFIYYARTANADGPYVCWFACSLVAYLAALATQRTRDYAWLACCAAAAVCTKDQAYGLYALMPVPLVIEAWRARRTRPRWLHAFLGRAAVVVLVGAGTVAVGQNLFLNWSGFVSHIQLLAGPASRTYVSFPRSIAGHLGLWAVEGRLVVRSFGWPATIVVIAGLIVAWGDRATRRAAWWLLVPLVSYDLTFLHVILYAYDRFLLPVVVVMSIFAGLALDRLIAYDRRIGGLVAAGVLVYGLLSAVTLDALTMADARYGARDWIDAHVPIDATVAIVQPTDDLPRLDGLSTAVFDSSADLAAARPDVVLLNADYARASTPDPDSIAAMLDDGRLGYRLVYRARTGPPFRWLPGISPDLVGPRPHAEVTSILRDVNPETAIYTRIR